jgi:hypothetical protein
METWGHCRPTIMREYTSRANETYTQPTMAAGYGKLAVRYEATLTIAVIDQLEHSTPAGI